MKLDLNKVKFDELPVKTISLQIAGKDYDVDINPVHGELIYTMGELFESKKIEKIPYKEIIMNALLPRPTLEQVNALVDADIAAAINIAHEILKFTEENVKSINEAKEKIKKSRGQMSLPI